MRDTCEKCGKTFPRDYGGRRPGEREAASAAFERHKETCQGPGRKAVRVPRRKR